MFRYLLVIAATFMPLALIAALPTAASAQDLRTLQARCTSSEGSPAVCLPYAQAAQLSGIPTEVTRGTKVLTASCLAGHGESCYYSGLASRMNFDGANYADWETGVFFRDGCDQNFAAACYELGYLYSTGQGVDQEQATALALYRKACALGYAKGCDGVDFLAPAGPSDPRYAQIPAIDPSLPAITQLAQAGLIVEGRASGDRQGALNTVIRLMEESNAGGEWLLAEWFAKGLPGLLDKNEGNAAILFQNAAKQGHVDAMIEHGMILWYGYYGATVDQDLGKRYMRVAANRGSQMAEAIWRSMEAEPIRQANARRQREMEAMEASQRASYSSRLSNAVSSWSSASSSSISASNSAARASWQRYEARQDATNFNNAIRYITGSASTCPSFNPYC